MLGCFAAFSCERVFAACLGRNHSHTPVSKMLWLVNVDTQRKFQQTLSFVAFVRLGSSPNFYLWSAFDPDEASRKRANSLKVCELG
jgi:hypothetical protein